MGLAWQQGPFAPGAIGRFLVPDPLPERLLYAEPLRRRVRVRFGGAWIADSEDVTLLHEPGRYEDAWTEVQRVSGLVSFEPDKLEVHLDGTRLRLEPGQTVIPHGVDRELTPDEIASRGQA
jgi:hypothetical protein